MGVVSFVLRTATISIFLSDTKCGPVCRAQTCAHSGVEPSRSAKAFLQAGPKTSKTFRIFHHFETLVHISRKLLKIEAYKQRSEKSCLECEWRVCVSFTDALVLFSFYSTLSIVLYGAVEHWMSGALVSLGDMI